MIFKKGYAYRISGIPRYLWAFPHPEYGRPSRFTGVFCSKLEMTRTWYAFEIYVRGVYKAAVFIPQEDFASVHIEELGAYPR